MIIDLQIVKEAYDSLEVGSDVILIPSRFDIADGLAKVRTNSILLNTIRSGKIDHLIARWIIHTTKVEVSVEKKGRESIILSNIYVR